MGEDDWVDIRRGIEDRLGGPVHEDAVVALHALAEPEVRVEGFWWAEPDQGVLWQLNAGIRGGTAGLAVGAGDPVVRTRLDRCPPAELPRRVVAQLPAARAGRRRLGPEYRTVVRVWKSALADPARRTAMGQVDICPGPYRPGLPRLGLGFTWVDLIGDGRYYAEKGSHSGPHGIDPAVMTEIVDSLIRRVRAGELRPV